MAQEGNRGYFYLLIKRGPLYTSSDISITVQERGRGKVYIRGRRHSVKEQVEAIVSHDGGGGSRL